jgi:hypothetical protein
LWSREENEKTAQKTCCDISHHGSKDSGPTLPFSSIAESSCYINQGRKALITIKASSAALPSIAPPPAFAWAGLRRITPYASVVAPQRLTSKPLLVIRNAI